VHFQDARLLVFAKAPEPGRVKTRLVPPLTGQEAASLHRDLLVRRVQGLAEAELARVELWCAPSPEFGVFGDLERDYGVDLYGQAGRDLGERMHGAVEEASRRARRLVLLGTDCPAMDIGYVTAALESLEKQDAVMGPAEDGGYVLLGLKQSAPELFSKIPWGTGEVAALTRERMRGLGWTWTELPTLWDLDRPEDLARYRKWSSPSTPSFTDPGSVPERPCSRSRPGPA
jgi:rSAM/selenodomain-associated transferase 1